MSSWQLHRAADTGRQRRDAIGVRVRVAIRLREDRQQAVELSVGIDGQSLQRLAQAREIHVELPVERVAPPARVARRPVPLERPRHRIPQAVPADRLGQVVDDTLAQVRDRGARVLHAGRHDERGFGRVVTNLVGEPEPVAPPASGCRTAHGGRAVVDAIHRLVRVRRGAHVVAPVLEPARKEIAHTRFVVHDQN
jgi:hypothetical protein